MSKIVKLDQVETWKVGQVREIKKDKEISVKCTYQTSSGFWYKKYMNAQHTNMIPFLFFHSWPKEHFLLTKNSLYKECHGEINCLFALMDTIFWIWKYRKTAVKICFSYDTQLDVLSMISKIKQEVYTFTCYFLHFVSTVVWSDVELHT